MKYVRSLKEIGVVQGILVALCIAGAIATVYFYESYQNNVRRLEMEIAGKKAELGQLQSAVGIVGTSVTDNQSMIDYLAAQISLMCKGQPTPGKPTTENLNRAQLRAHDLNAYGGCITTAPVVAFLAKYNAALTARLNGDYAKALPLFREAIDLGSASAYVDDQWKARAWEGTAYTAMKLAKYPEARHAQAEAQRLFPGFVFAGITKIKLQCAANEPAPGVQSSLTALRAALDADVAGAVARGKKAANPTQVETAANHLRYAKLDRSYVEADGELFAMCAYANVAPVALAR